MQTDYTATDEVRAVLDRIGRTEDLKFSPDGGRLAVAGINSNRLLVIGIETHLDAIPPKIALTSALEIESASLHAPHGVCWPDEQTLIVANRTGQITVFELPADPPSVSSATLEPVHIIGPELGGLVNTPGSISILHLGLDLVELLVCNNYVHNVARLVLDQRNAYAVIASEALLHEGLDVPDGIARCPSGHWIAVSNHTHQNVSIYRNDGSLNHKSPPHAVLHGLSYPHGLKFVAGGASLLVADAAEPCVHVFSRGDDWTGAGLPTTSIRVLDDMTFQKGQHSQYEGGPKGMDVTRDGRMMVTTCDEQPLAFFDLASLQLPSPPPPDRTDETDEAERAREALLGYLSTAQSRMQEALEVVRDAGRRQLEEREREFLESHSWRITAPLRWIRKSRS